MSAIETVRDGLERADKTAQAHFVSRDRFYDVERVALDRIERVVEAAKGLEFHGDRVAGYGVLLDALEALNG